MIFKYSLTKKKFIEDTIKFLSEVYDEKDREKQNDSNQTFRK